MIQTFKHVAFHHLCQRLHVAIFVMILAIQFVGAQQIVQSLLQQRLDLFSRMMFESLSEQQQK